MKQGAPVPDILGQEEADQDHRDRDAAEQSDDAHQGGNDTQGEQRGDTTSTPSPSSSVHV